ncbi:MAG: hypothetical protein ABI300_11805 [Rhodanobacter sp.]
MNAPDTRLAERARALYRSAANHVDADTCARLRDARARALASSDAPPRGARWLVPGGALAAVAVAALMLWQQPLPHGAAPALGGSSVAVDADNDLPPDAEQTDPMLYQNLDFYGWLAASNSTASRR